MAWTDDMPTIVRYLINDLDTTNYAYSNGRVRQTIVVAAQLVLSEIDFDKTYTVTISTSGISPDPTAATKDDAFINLVSLKSACLIASSELRTKGLDAIRVSDGSSSIDAGGILRGFEILSKDLCQRYENAKIQYKAGNSVAGQAILSPYESPNFPVVHGEGHNTRTGYFE
jgi:hypothetical protein